MASASRFHKRMLAASLCAVVAALLAGPGLVRANPEPAPGQDKQAPADETVAQLLVLVRAGIGYETISVWLDTRGGVPALNSSDLALLREAGAADELLNLLRAAEVGVASPPASAAPGDPSPATPPLDSQMPVATFRSRVELVRVPVVVLDDDGEYVRDLQAEDFLLWEQGQPQRINSLIEVQAPVSVGLLVDTSGSMSDKIDAAEDALEHFFRTLQANDDIFVIGFSSQPELLRAATAERSKLRLSRRSLLANGGTALYDAVIAGLEILESADADKRALVVITDGMDNSSRAGMEETLELARRSEVAIYTIGIGHRTESNRGRDRHGSSRGRLDFDERALRDLAESTGGRAYLLIGDDHHHGGENDRLKNTAVTIATAINHEYLLLYAPLEPAAKGEWRTIRVETTREGYKVRARPGYSGTGPS